MDGTYVHDTALWNANVCRSVRPCDLAFLKIFKIINIFKISKNFKNFGKFSKFQKSLKSSKKIKISKFEKNSHFLIFFQIKKKFKILECSPVGVLDWGLFSGGGKVQLSCYIKCFCLFFLGRVVNILVKLKYCTVPNSRCSWIVGPSE